MGSAHNPSLQFISVVRNNQYHGHDVNVSIQHWFGIRNIDLMSMIRTWSMKFFAATTANQSQHEKSTIQLDHNNCASDIRYGESLYILLLWKNDHRKFCQYARLCLLWIEMGQIARETTNIYPANDSKYAKARLLSWILCRHYGLEYIFACKLNVVMLNDLKITCWCVVSLNIWSI